jgi:hypothetical protein
VRSRRPEIVENIEKIKQRRESLECPNALAKQEFRRQASAVRLPFAV